MNRYFLIFISLLIITPLGLLSKVYTGVGQEWINNYSGDILYEIFWCLIFFSFFASKKAITIIPILVFIITSTIEVAQLWFKYIPVTIRSHIIWRLLLGSAFAWWDFFYYGLGCILGWLLLTKIAQISQRSSQLN
ncbi:MAG TPA: DUF2809 domain-containing protein [Xenococcaceae cyanobacterium]|jgi:hypothetical protein